MAEPQRGDASGGSDHGTNLGTRRKGAAAKHAMAAAEAASTSPPCGACKFLRRKCISGCIFAPHFGSDQGAARFAAVHKVFGASNVSKLLLHIPVNRRHEAVVTISYEAQARLSDPVYGCVSTILALQQQSHSNKTYFQVTSLQGELSMVQNQLINSRLAYANVLHHHQCTQQHHHHHHNQPNMINVSLLQQPAYSNNNSSASTNNNLVNMNTFNNNNNHSGF
ncbi:hypothetical protein PIB30_058456 [Stylosanthes scabra]|uniref:LOB domain-containing protein n=1 Tax=Stylosanthes scabra TaxID=79078 RepID=A0ABU6UKS8_9FABA|nr:hypothetical protein [Stylosanthes scabra]